MRAVQLTRYGDPKSAIQVMDLPEPDAPGVGEVLVGMEYAPVNLNDLLVLQGLFPVHPELPSPVGNEGLGRVLAVGPDVSNVSVGEVVVLPLYSLTWRERLVVPASGVFAVPKPADLQQLSMLRINAVTAALLLSEYADLHPGDWIVQNAGNSAVARSVVAIAKSRGFKTISLVRRPDLIEEMITDGADASFLDDEGSFQQISSLVGQDRIRLALDGVGGPAAGRLASVLGAGGALVSYAVLGGEVAASVSILDVIFKNLTYRGFYLDRTEYDAILPNVIAETADLIASGKLHVPVAAVYKIDEVGRAIEHVQKGGKALLSLGG
ncbi:zinc-dependent alcohol dehydrogenase family protein [Hyphomicrobium sp.]|uniref:zinc-dependent alcohol dehydrogenase family protein n=1 Tax=Hyphomicrobium sp. TaxID=82 RepID=UPI0025C0E71F|nr:zinc-dependent alcohol dehydrogenase family protein [Hyphomicrobium sp.]MCC7252869.1 zinc-dependent alcohol dehydrogenase family protein [Hyphomicrobium sp.]